MTHFSTLTATLSVAILLATSGPSLAGDEYRKITTASEFSKLVVGKKLHLGSNYLVIKNNGKLTGKFSGKSLKGIWEWRGGYWCRTLSTHSKGTDCQLWTTNGTDFLVYREKGNGKSFAYTK